MPGAYDRSRNAAVVRQISANFDSAISDFFGTRAPNREAAQGAHDAYVAALRAHGTDVTVLPALDEYPDCCFVEDTAVMVNGKAIIPNMGHPSREGEQVAVAEHLSSSAEIINMPKGAKLDGGDVVFFDDRYLIGFQLEQIGRVLTFLRVMYEKTVWSVSSSTSPVRLFTLQPCAHRRALV